MSGIPLWLMAGNEELRSRWRRWLNSTDDWNVTELTQADELPNRLGRSNQAGPALLDAAVVTDQDLAAIRKKTSGRVSLILFGQGADASDAAVVHWLQAGADDFIPASVQEKVLLAKLAAHARRLRPELLKEQS